MTFEHWNMKIMLLITAGLALGFAGNCLAAEIKLTDESFYRTYEEKSVVYYDTEWSDKIPGEKEFVITQEGSNRQQTVKLPQLWTEYGDSVWKDSFEFPIVVENWDADYYMLGDEAIPQKAENPFDGYEELLLRQLGLPPTHYVITAAHWDGAAYEEQGIWYRKAVAEGRKLVADVSVHYGGEVTWQGEAAPPAETEAQTQEKELPESSQAETVLFSAAEEENSIASQEPHSIAEMLRRIVTTLWMMKISILFVLLLVLGVYILVRYCKKRRSRKIED